MIQSRILVKRIIIGLLIITPLGLMAILTVKILVPGLKDPNSAAYGSKMGYPASQRSKGQAIEVETAQVTQKSVETALVAPGETVGDQEVNVRNQVTATVDKIYVKEGERVNKGELLLELNKAEFENQLEEAKKSLEIAKNELISAKIEGKSRIKTIEKEIQGSQEQLKQTKMLKQNLDAINEAEIKENTQIIKKK